MAAFVTPTPFLRPSVQTTTAVTTRRSTFVRPKSRLHARPIMLDTTPRASLESDVREALIALFKEKPCMPIMVRLAWHDSGTFDHKDGTGGPNASIRFTAERSHGANNGLQIAMDLLEPIKQKFPAISYADLFQLASVTGIEFAGGPKIPYRMGRVDASEGECTPDGRLPDASKGMSHLRDIFYRMGFNDAEITVLSGAHTLGAAHKDRSGFDGPWTKVPVKFDNSYYVEILKENPDPDLLRLTSDLALLDVPETKALCEKYASDQDAFFADYVPAHKKLSELGCFA